MAFSDQQSDAPLRFACPRCGVDVAEHWYGPCETCRETLQATVRGTPGDVVVAAYEPKVNVTPNAVAMKE